MRFTMLTLWLAALLPGQLQAFQLPPPLGVARSTGRIAREQLPLVLWAAADVSVEEISNDEASIQSAAQFLVDSFWLDPRHVLDGSNPADGIISDVAKESLYAEQTDDLMDKYGERMGQRALESAILTATDTASGDVLGMVCISALLLDSDYKALVPHDVSEELLKGAVASLGPKDRRKYKNASPDEIATDLLSSDTKQMAAVCCLSNLAVSTKARRRGVAALLCAEAERMAGIAEGWGYDAMLLRVEADNAAARTLYEDKLGYTEMAVEPDAVAFRVDTQEGSFTETTMDTLLLVKELS